MGSDLISFQNSVQLYNAPQKTLTFNGTYGAGEATGAYNPAVTLNGAIDAAVTAIVVSDGTLIITNQCILIGTEEMRVTAGGGTVNLTVTRAANGTTAATHANGVAVTRSADNSTAIWTVSGTVLILFASFKVTTGWTFGGGGLSVGSTSVHDGLIKTYTSDPASGNYFRPIANSATSLQGILALLPSGLIGFPSLVNESIKAYHTTADLTLGGLLCDAIYVPITTGASLT